MRTKYWSFATLAVSLFALIGCSGDKKLFPVEGVVTVDGKPLEGASVYFTSDNGTVSSGMTSASGKFKLITKGVEGTPSGSYKVYVTKSPPLGGAGDSTYKADDPTKSYTEMMKKSGAKVGSKGSIEIPKPASEVPERYTKPGALPDQVVPASGPISIELKSK